jgi:hypothetical protein
MGWRTWWMKRRWYERNARLRRRWRINRHAARGGFYVRHPVEGELLEALDDGRLSVGEGTLLEPGCWITMSRAARIAIGAGCFLNRGVMLAANERIEIGDHVMFANGCFVGDADHRYDDPDVPVTWQGFVFRGELRGDRRCRDRGSRGDRGQLGRDQGHPPGNDRGRRARKGGPSDRLPQQPGSLEGRSFAVRLVY